MIRLALVFVAGLLVAGDSPKEDAKAVEQLLRTLNDAYFKKDVDTMKRLMSDDHVAIVASGQRESKEEHLKSLADLKLTEYTMEDVKVTMPSKDVAIITYRANVKGSFKGKELPPKITASSVWANRNGKWQEVLYQETAVEKK
jgi:uncharacterized protein (TIGR02246 family)